MKFEVLLNFEDIIKHKKGVSLWYCIGMKAGRDKL